MPTLLLVEDHAPDRELYRRYLMSDSSGAYSFVEADCVAAALELCRTQTIDAVLLDDGLPDGNGLVFLRSLQAYCRGKPPAVVMISGRGDEMVAVQAIKLGAEDYLIKQRLTPELLQLTVRSAIENTRLRLQLRQSEDRYRAIVEDQTELICRFTPEGILTFVNPAYSRYFGFTPEQLLGRNLLTLIPESESAIVQQQLAELRAATPENSVMTHEHAVRQADGTIGWQQWTNRAIFDDNGQLVELQAVGRDIRDRLGVEDERKRGEVEPQQAEQRLRESEERLQLGIQVAGVALAKFDYKTDRVELSPEAAALYGLPSDQLRVTRDLVHATFHPEERGELFAIIRQVLDPDGAGWFAREHRVVWRNGEVRWLSVRKQVFFERSGESARPSYAILAAVDVTERKLAEAERERLLAVAEAARQEAEAANRSKDEFVAVVAHELRSPLNSIAGWAKILQMRQFDEATLSRALDTIVRNTEVQVQLVEDLLDISRIVRGTLRIDLAPMNVVNVVEAALNIVRPLAEAKQIGLNAELPTMLQVLGDANRLQQVVLNLLTNAIKFTPQGGQVELELGQVDSQMQLCVRDTGKGIAPEFLPLIFERYQQGQNNTESKDGLGLGLAIVKHLVDLHSGSITAESQGKGQGAIFTVCLPLLDASIERREVSNSIEIDTLDGIRILVVDDEPDQIDLLVFVLKEAGAIVRSSNSGNSALPLISQFQPNILISDIAMHDGNGYELVQQMRLQPHGDIPAIALTAYASTSDEERSLQAGFQSHLAKPFDPEKLIAVIRQLVGEPRP